MLKNVLKKYIVWMLISYLLVIGVVHTFILIPQRNTLEKYRRQKAEMEFNYMKMTGSPAFLRNIDNSINTALEKTSMFEWVEGKSGIDHGLVFYNHIYSLAEKAEIELVEIVVVEERTARRAQQEQIYYKWQTRFHGSFQNLLRMVALIESDKNFTIIEEISIGTGREADGKPFYNIIFKCLRKNAHAKTT